MTWAGLGSGICLSPGLDSVCWLSPHNSEHIHTTFASENTFYETTLVNTPILYQ